MGIPSRGRDRFGDHSVGLLVAAAEGHRGVDRQGTRTNWSQARTFTIPPGAAAMPMPPHGELLARISWSGGMT